MTFKELFQTGQCSISAIDAWVEIWHKEKVARQSLQDLLGLTDKEYRAWLMQGNAGLAQLLNDGHMPEYEAVYLGWDELTAQLQEIVNTELGSGYTVSLHRQDYYYWDMQVKTDQEMDETLSEQICKRLDLQDVDVLMFLDDDWVDSNHLFALLSKLTHREVTSSHADDYGVWIICDDFVFITDVNFGGNEGIYLVCYAKGRISEDGEKKLWRLGTYKTLGTSLSDMQIFGKLGGTLTFFARKYLWDNSERFLTDRELRVHAIKEKHKEGKV